MPGVVVNTGVRIGGAGAEQAPSSTLFVVGTSERGRTTAYTVRSMSEFVAEYGDYTGDGVLHQHVQAFFEEGGVRAIVARVVGPAATTGSHTLEDSAAGNAIVLTAANAGEWSEELTVDTANETTSFSMTIKLKGSTIFTGSFSTNAAAIAAVNNTVGHIVTASAGASSNLPDTGSFTFTAGDADLDAASDTVHASALDEFGDELGTGVVAIPERYGSTIWGALATHAEANKRVAFASFSAATSYTSAITAAASYAGTTDAEKNKFAHLAFFWPQVVVPDGAGGTRSISPESYAAAARARQIIAAGGPWKPAAGITSAARFALGLSSNGTATKVPKTISNALDDGRVNAIRVIDGQIRIYGARSASADTVNWRYITYRDTVNQIATSCEKALEQFVFSPIDNRKALFGAISSSLVSILDAVKDAGGLYSMVDGLGNQVDRGYSVEVNDSLNPLAQLAEGLIVAKVGVRVAGVADLITLTITKSSLTAAL